MFTKIFFFFFFFSSRRRHTRLQGDWSSDVCSSDLEILMRRTPTPSLDNNDRYDTCLFKAAYHAQKLRRASSFCLRVVHKKRAGHKPDRLVITIALMGH